MAEKKKRALVVDDQAMNRTFIKIYLSTKGYEVEKAEDGLLGLKACKAEVFDLVFSDMEMPNMNGMEFLRAIKRLPQYASVPVVILSQLDSPELISQMKSLGARYYMVKPFTTEKMDDLFSQLP